MNHVDFVYGKYKDLFISPCFRKSRIELGSDFLIVMNANLEMFYLAEIAKAMMEAISKGIRVDDLFQKLQADYDVSAIQLKNDLIDFIKEMQWKSIVSLSVLAPSQ